MYDIITVVCNGAYLFGISAKTILCSLFELVNFFHCKSVISSIFARSICCLTLFAKFWYSIVLKFILIYEYLTTADQPDLLLLYLIPYTLYRNILYLRLRGTSI